MGSGKWPVVGTIPHSIPEHATQFKEKARLLQQHVQSLASPNPTIKWSQIFPLITSASELADKVNNQPSIAQVMAEIRDVKRDTTAMEQHLTVVKNIVQAPISKGNSQVATTATTGYRNIRR